MTPRFKPVHLALTHQDKVHCITTSENTLQELLATPGGDSTLTIYRDVSPLVVLQYLEGEAPWRRLADDQAWSNLSEAMPEFQKHMAAYPEQPSTPAYRQIPPDFPPVLVEGRSQVIETHPSIADISTLRELTEIYMAATHQREVNHAHFRRSSLETAWGLYEHFSLDMLYEHLDDLDRKIATDHGEDARLSAKMAQEFQETRFLIDDLESHESPSPSINQ